MADRNSVYGMVRRAIARGVLVRPESCSRCGAPDTKQTSGRHTIEGHHYKGYDHPLDVEWLCSKCHRAVTPMPEKIGGPAFGETNGAARLSASDIAAIRSSPMTGGRLAAKLGVARSTVNRVRRGETWNER